VRSERSGFRLSVFLAGRSGNVVGLGGGGILVELEAENTHAAILVVGPGPMVGEKGGSS